MDYGVLTSIERTCAECGTVVEAREMLTMLTPWLSTAVTEVVFCPRCGAEVRE
jgi:ribosomal protein S27AE